MKVRGEPVTQKSKENLRKIYSIRVRPLGSIPLTVACIAFWMTFSWAASAQELPGAVRAGDLARIKALDFGRLK